MDYKILVLTAVTSVTVLSGIGALLLALTSGPSPAQLETEMFRYLASVFTFGAGAITGLIGGGVPQNNR
jgi:hypothetical protein